MKSLRRAALTMITLTAVLAATVGSMHASKFTPESQQPQQTEATDPESYFDEVVQRLELTADQQQALEVPLQQVIVAMEELQRLHDVIATELTDTQQGKLAHVFHEVLGGSLGEQLHGGDHGQGHHGRFHH